jgi:hypothetical protein
MTRIIFILSASAAETPDSMIEFSNPCGIEPNIFLFRVVLREKRDYGVIGEDFITASVTAYVCTGVPGMAYTWSSVPPGIDQSLHIHLSVGRPIPASMSIFL